MNSANTDSFEGSIDKMLCQAAERRMLSDIASDYRRDCQRRDVRQYVTLIIVTAAVVSLLASILLPAACAAIHTQGSVDEVCSQVAQILAQR